MECMLLPNSPAGTLPRVPLVAELEYDGKDWLTYPTRMGRTRMLPDSNDPEAVPYRVYENSHPTPIAELESFFQTYLFFGLISEALGGNTTEEEPPSEISESSTEQSLNSNTVLRSIYRNFISKTGEESYITTASFLSSLQESWTPSPTNGRDVLIGRVERLRLCLKQAWWFFVNVHPDFDPRIKFSIGAVGEILTYTIHVAGLLLKIDGVMAADWTGNFYKAEVVPRAGYEGTRERMLRLGWCPSDLARCTHKFNRLQMLCFLSTLDRRRPYRDHTHCDEVQCKFYQIDPKEYGERHSYDGCSCQQIAVDIKKLVEILEMRDSVPLLRFVGDKDNLAIEVVPSSKDTPYVAISHVWADGLGNPFANSLHRCQLVQLRSFVEGIEYNSSQGTERPIESEQIPLIWLDTLCCPIEPAKMKELSLTKMRQVYQQATAVLVLDASLQSYDATEMDLIEQLARIFTSGWLRRLWTLQEGALAASLFFQFQKGSVSFDALRKEFMDLNLNLRYRIINMDLLNEYNRIQQFFYPESVGLPPADLALLDMALLHRGVSVLSDEPICISTLMSLPMEPVLKVPIQDRMAVVWHLVAQKENGLPSEIIFLEDKRLRKPGYRWAPASLLTTEPQMHGPSTRILRWKCEQRGRVTKDGLRVVYPGFKLMPRQHNDGRPRNPWRGLRRIAESAVLFRDTKTFQWFNVGTKEYAFRSSTWTEEQHQEWKDLHGFPLHDLLNRGDCSIIVKEMQDTVPSSELVGSEGTIVSLIPHKDLLSHQGVFGWPRRMLSGFWKRSTELYVKSEVQVLFFPVRPVEGLLYTIVEPLALRLRKEPITDRLLEIADIESEEYKVSLEQLKQRMKDMLGDALSKSPIVERAVKLFWGDDIIESLWVLIGNWFNHDFIGTRLPEDQVWIVD